MALDQTIKQRLIGAIVLVAIAVIFLPGILGQKQARKVFISKVPQEPKVKQVNSEKSSLSNIELNKSDHISSTETPLTDEEAANQLSADKTNKKDSKEAVTNIAEIKTDPAESKTLESKKSSKETLSLQGKDSSKKDIESSKSAIPEFRSNSWVIQVGSFSSHTNAVSLSKKLEEADLKSFVRPVTFKSEKLLYRVYVGPWFEKQKATQMVEKVKEIARLDPLVVNWEANSQ